jgi:ABC-type methionine transport system permease subunit
MCNMYSLWSSSEGAELTRRSYEVLRLFIAGVLAAFVIGVTVGWLLHTDDKSGSQKRILLATAGAASIALFAIMRIVLLLDAAHK